MQKKLLYSISGGSFVNFEKNTQITCSAGINPQRQHHTKWVSLVTYLASIRDTALESHFPMVSCMVLVVIGSTNNLIFLTAARKQNIHTY